MILRLVFERFLDPEVAPAQANLGAQSKTQAQLPDPAQDLKPKPEAQLSDQGSRAHQLFDVMLPRRFSDKLGPATKSPVHTKCSTICHLGHLLGHPRLRPRFLGQPRTSDQQHPCTPPVRRNAFSATTSFARSNPPATQ
ncbi:hypothetical protein LXL04_015161 [Taraxacum kok-saghyz]